MAFYFSFKSVVLLFFFVQGLIYSLLLLKRSVELDIRSGIWMGLFIFLCSLYISPWMFGYAGWYGLDGYREVLFFLPLQHYFLLGPVIYFYSATLMNPSYTFCGKDRLHFIPGLLYLLYALIVFIYDVFIVDDYFFYADGRDKDLDPLYQIAGTLYLMIYLSVCIRMYFRYRSRIYEELSFADSVSYKWFKRFLIVMVIILLVRTVFLILFPDWGDFGIKFWYYAIFSVLIFYIALNSYVNTITLSIPFNLQAAGLEDDKAVGRLPEDMGEIKNRLQDLMKEKELYKNPTLALADLSGELMIPKEQVSAVINKGFEMNFNDFINSHRVNEVKKRLESGETSTHTMLGIALECGFNSKTTFNRAFKKYTGCTPMQYLKKAEESCSKS